MKDRTGFGARLTLWLATMVIGSGLASATIVVVPGQTFSVASLSGVPAAGTHFHSDHAGALGSPPDKAEVGSLQDQALSMEECRGLSEFNLAGLSPGTATLQLRVDHLGGLFGGNAFPFIGNIGLIAYAGNNADDIGDYSAAPVSLLGTFGTSGLSPGLLLSFDVTAAYNARLAAGSPALGVRLQTTPSTVTGGGAFTFDSFTLTVVSTPEPEPGALALLWSGTLLCLARRNRSARGCGGAGSQDR
ncbi:MAG: hypothetical protein K8R23_07600 [Chthoniobacter sp.]|nr:hypothetical protein [Chthoniobacter sp.]